MFRRFGILALILSATGAAVLPKAAFAQDSYHAPRDNYYQVDRDGHRYEARESRDGEQDRRAEEWRRRASPWSVTGTNKNAVRMPAGRTIPADVWHVDVQRFGRVDLTIARCDVLQ